MTHAAPRHLRTLFALAVAALLAACQSMPAPKGFIAAQIAVLKEEGFIPAPAATDDSWQLTMADRLLFATNESAIQPEQTERLGTLARRLIAVGIPSARVEGHTDSTGAPDYNQKLSEARAQAVAAPLIAGGMQFAAGQIIGRGETMPLSPNDTPEGRQDNRRVVIIVTP